MSEGGIGWVAGLMDRLEHCFQYQLGYLPTWRDVELTPSEVLRRNFWFCAIDDASGFLTRDVIGVENICVESDYPHADSTWPDTQPRLQAQLNAAGVSAAAAELICWRNAAELFRLR